MVFQALLLALAACTGDDVIPAPALEASWIGELVAAPGTFGERIGGAREGWIALHRNDWRSAVSVGGDPAARAHRELRELYLVLAEMDAEVWARLGSEWSARGTLPTQSVVSTLIGAALREAGRNDEALAWAAGPITDETLLARQRLHETMRQGRDAQAATDLGGLPLISEPIDGGRRDLADPWLLWTLAAVEDRAYTSQVVKDDALFSEKIGLNLVLPGAAADPMSDADACREAVRSWDGSLDGWRATLTAGATAEGRELLSDLRLVEGARARTLVQLAVSALGTGRPSCALALGQMALDHESPRQVGPVNSPTLFAVLASAQLGVGRTREALDAIEVLATDWPAVRGLDETLSTLVVLEGLDRRGDSRE